MAVMIGVDPHKASHTAAAIGPAEEPLGQVRIQACASQVEQLVAWAAAWPERTWAVEGATGLGSLASDGIDADQELTQSPLTTKRSSDCARSQWAWCLSAVSVQIRLFGSASS